MVLAGGTPDVPNDEKGLNDSRMVTRAGTICRFPKREAEVLQSQSRKCSTTPN
jgi:hypothetical protein